MPLPTDINGDKVPYPFQDLLQLKSFRLQIRSYNNAVSFASMGAHIICNDQMNAGPYVFKIHGQTYHATSHTRTSEGEEPVYAQLYVLDSNEALSKRMEHQANVGCNPDILQRIDTFIREHNPIAQNYHLMREIEEEESKKNSPGVVSLIFRADRQTDLRRFNAPATEEIAMVFVDEDGAPPWKRDIRVYPRHPTNPNAKFVNIDITSPNLEGFCYALLFPYGTSGWHPNWISEPYPGVQLNPKQKTVTMLQFKVAHLAVRDGYFNPVLRAGKLSHQWIVDSYVQVEANNLHFIKFNQKKLRAEIYQGVADFVANHHDGSLRSGERLGVPIILPSSFEGSPRNMRQRCNDAMCIFRKFGSPDLFITMTANPYWAEIKKSLYDGENPNDRPDIVARVFRLKLQAMLKDCIENQIFGKVIAWVYSIEFQKRGLPHSHILLTLDNSDKFTTIEKIDQYISAEIPNSQSHRVEFEMVTKLMIHGPCKSCLSNGKCVKGFPKPFRENTDLNPDGYSLYKRRNNGSSIQKGSTSLDNRYVVPYNRFLLLKYGCHINVEVCTSMSAIKYIYKYIYKGYDSARLSMITDAVRNDEVRNFIDCRYISAPEACWRLFEFSMHDRSHSIIRLPIHLPEQHTVIFEVNENVIGNIENALRRSKNKKTMLEAWFELNQNEPEARNFYYFEIPEHYVFDDKKHTWRLRKRFHNVVPRLYTVSFKDEERYCLRLLLLHVKGAQSWRDLKTVDGMEFISFKETAIARKLLESTAEWNNCMEEACHYQMPTQLRELFAYLCCFIQLFDAKTLWEKFEHYLIMDYSNTYEKDLAKRYALQDLDHILRQHDFSCQQLGLEYIPIERQDEFSFEIEKEKEIADRQIPLLNEKQRTAFDRIIRAIDNPEQPSSLGRCFFIDGPGGSGKTFLFTTLLSFIRSRNQLALPYATTGMAATLLKGGRTVHSGFKLELNLTSNSTSRLKLNSSEAVLLCAAKLIIIDEITMLHKDGLRCIHESLQEIMGNSLPFGGKVTVISGDFRQTLPVISKGTIPDILGASIKFSSLWKCFIPLTLNINMRSIDDHGHNDWLLKVGTGEANLAHPQHQFLEIPNNMITNGNLIEEIFSNDVSQLSREELSERVIVCPTNGQCLEINRKIIESLPNNGTKIYYSADSIDSKDENDAAQFPIEMFYNHHFSGLPPHVLVLKIGVVIMLIRNLNPRIGLCNGTRLLITDLANNFIQAEILTEFGKGTTVLIPRIDLSQQEALLGLTIKRRQFPVIPAYAVTINKSQGQSYQYVGINLETPVFSHGQLYVALSRSRIRENIKIFITNTNEQGNIFDDDRIFTKNIVYRQVFN